MPRRRALLGVFAACHDLRQRESGDREDGIGANELASIAETRRILVGCGFHPERDRAAFATLELMIAGSSFDASPPVNPAEAAATAGALAPRLPALLDRLLPRWRDDPVLRRGVRLAMVASDLDIGNVGESFDRFCLSSARLCVEREALAGRRLDGRESFAPVLVFLSDGQERYFFELHRFSDPLGERAFGAEKAANAPRVRALAAALRNRFGGASATGGEVLAAFLAGAGCALDALGPSYGQAAPRPSAEAR
ncbi:MAG: hypothetical protein RML12_01525 [Xanthomonadales bacterium]|nr:hypothetical protein [Xanthomonadales bacterium]